MITGFNTDVEYEGVVYHVQTEDKGLNSPLILSLVYVGGTILASKRSRYEDLIASGFDERELTLRLQRQHQLICAAIRSGRLEDLKRMSKREAETRTTQKAKPSKPASAASNSRPDQAPAAPPTLPPKPAPPAKAKPAGSPADNRKQAAPPPVKTDTAVAAPVEGELHLVLLKEKEFRGGETVTLRVRVSRGPEEGQNTVADAPVTVKILGTAFRPIISSAQTDENGIASVSVTLPRFTTGRAALLIHVAIDGKEAEIRRIIHQG